MVTGRRSRLQVSVAKARSPILRKRNVESYLSIREPSLTLNPKPYAHDLEQKRHLPHAIMSSCLRLAKNENINTYSSRGLGLGSVDPYNPE